MWWGRRDSEVNIGMEGATTGAQGLKSYLVKSKGRLTGRSVSCKLTSQAWLLSALFLIK